MNRDAAIAMAGLKSSREVFGRISETSHHYSLFILRKTSLSVENQRRAKVSKGEQAEECAISVTRCQENTQWTS